MVDEIVREFQDEVVIPELPGDFLPLMRAKLERLYAIACSSRGNSNVPRWTRHLSTCFTAASKPSAVREWAGAADRRSAVVRRPRPQAFWEYPCPKHSRQCSTKLLA